MVVEDYPLDEVLAMTRVTLGGHIGMTALLDEVAAQPRLAAGACAGIDAAASTYNDLGLVSPIIPDTLPNTRLAKAHFNRLPLIYNILHDTGPLRRGACRGFQAALPLADGYMGAAEQPDPVEPYLAFHRWPGATLEARVTGAALWLYGLTTHLQASTRDVYPRTQTTLDALLEMAASTERTREAGTLFSTACELGWYDAPDGKGGHLFSDAVRAAVRRATAS